MKRSTLWAVCGALVVCGGVAVAQITNIPASLGTALPLSQDDQVIIIKHGLGGVPSVTAPVGTGGGIDTYEALTPVTGFTITAKNSTTLMLLTPAGTLATGTLNLPQSPSDGQKFCLFDTQTQTAITVAAASGQTIAGGAALTALVANTQYCYRYVGVKSTWYRTS